MSATPSPVPSTLPRKGIAKISYTHDAMVDVILSDPTVTPQELAEIFGYSRAWISRILASDAFAARLAARKAAVVDPIIVQSLNKKMESIVIQSAHLVQDKLDAEQSASYAMEALGVAAQFLRGKA